MSLQGTVVNGTIVLDHGQSLPDGVRVEVILKDAAAKQPTLSERLLRHSGTVNDLPSDMAEQHDHYVHGTPRR